MCINEIPKTKEEQSVPSESTVVEEKITDKIQKKKKIRTEVFQWRRKENSIFKAFDVLNKLGFRLIFFSLDSLSLFLKKMYEYKNFIVHKLYEKL